MTRQDVWRLIDEWAATDTDNEQDERIELVLLLQDIADQRPEYRHDIEIAGIPL